MDDLRRIPGVSKRDSRALDLTLAAALGRKAVLILATGLAITIVVVPLLVLLAPELVRP